MITEISAALGSIKATSDIVKGISAAAGEVKLNEVKLELQRALLEASHALFAAQTTEAGLNARIGELEKQIIQMKDWSTEKQRYELHDIGRGAFAYVPKLGMEFGEPPHWLCVRCFGQGQKSFMQYKGNGSGAGTTADRGRDKTFACEVCKSSFSTYYNISPKSDFDLRLKRLHETQEAEQHMRDSSPP